MSTPVTEAVYTLAATVKTLAYGAQYAFARRAAGPVRRPGQPAFASPHPQPEPAALLAAFREPFDLERRWIGEGLYPAPDWGREARGLRFGADYRRDLADIERRRMADDATEVRADPASQGFPAYFRQNFHWQSGGWFSEESARLYDFQVEALFTGSAAAMRRATALALLAQALRGRDPRGLALMDLACGTGGFARDVARTVPAARLIAADLSPAYVRRAARSLDGFARAQALCAAAEALPLADASLDAITCVYLFHELPPRVRGAVLAEVARVLRPGGTFVLADALRTADNPALDRMLDAFPYGFHEPFFASWLACDIEELAREAGLEPVGAQRAYLTRAVRFVKR